MSVPPKQDPPAADPPADPPAPSADPPAPPAATGGDDELDGFSPEAQRLVRQLRNESAASRKRIKELEDADERRRRESETETDKRVREATEQARTDTAAEYELRLAEADVIAAAAGRLHDPRDALGHLPMREIADEQDPKRREKLITDRLEQLVDDKPYLLASGGGNGPARGGGLVSQGARSGTPPRGGEGDPDAWLRKARRR